MNSSKTLRARLDSFFGNKLYLISFVIVIAGFHICYGLDVVLPGNINWLMSAYHDWGQHYLGWAYFRAEPWHFPLGQIENFNYPAGTNVGYTDSIPLLAIFFKLFSFLLPETFQYLGMWLLACHLLAAYFAMRIFECYKIKAVYAVPAVVLVAFNPVLIYRGLHPALCGHWLILASLYFYISVPTAKNVLSLNRNQLVILMLAAAINPYLFLMVAGFNVILPLRHFVFDKLIGLKAFLGFSIGAFVSVLFIWWIIGMIGSGSAVAMEVTNSYGLYSLNLNGLYNSSGFSRILPKLEWVADQQYEGYAYLGLGMLLLLALSIAIFLIQKRSMLKNKPMWLLFALLWLCTAFAVTHIVTIDDNTLVEIPIPGTLMKLGGIFRACGRFVWVVYYALLLFGIVVFTKSRLPQNLKIIVFSLLAAVQLYDTSPLFTFRDLPSGSYTPARLGEANWVNAMKGAEKIVTYPPFINTLGYRMDYQDLCFLALKNHLPITCGYVARETPEINAKFTDSLRLGLAAAQMNPDDVFVTIPSELNAFAPLIAKHKAKLRYLDGMYLIYSAKAKETLAMSPSEKKMIDSVFQNIEKSARAIKIAKPVFEKDLFKYNVEKASFTEGVLQIKGWAFEKTASENAKDSLFLVLSNPKNTFLFPMATTLRPDVGEAFQKPGVQHCGFSASAFVDRIPNEDYDIGLAIKSKSGSWRYELLANSPVTSIKKTVKPMVLRGVPKTNDKFIGNLENAEGHGQGFSARGWAAIENVSSESSEINLILVGKQIFAFGTVNMPRKDVTAYYQGKTNYDKAGFEVIQSGTGIPKGKYDVGIWVKNGAKSAFYLTGKKIVISQ